MDNVDLAWLAGLLEGEGCFRTYTYRNPAGPTRAVNLELNMTDLDVVERAASLMGCPAIRAYGRENPKHKVIYRCALHGHAAVEMMLKLEPMMGARRSEKIWECVTEWYEHIRRVCVQCGSEFIRRERHSGKKIFCSKECQQARRNERDRQSRSRRKQSV